MKYDKNGCRNGGAGSQLVSLTAINEQQRWTLGPLFALNLALRIPPIHQGHIGIKNVGVERIPTIVPIFTSDTSAPQRTPLDEKPKLLLGFSRRSGRCWTVWDGCLVPLAGIEPALLAELDFESSASTNSATGAQIAFVESGSESRLQEILQAARIIACNFLPSIAQPAFFDRAGD